MVLLFIGYIIVYRLNNFATTDVTHTFVVLAYKKSKYLETCIKSLINQTKKTNVIIFTTTPNHHIEELARKYHLPLKTGEHKSIGGDFDLAIKAADTTLVTIAHQDDFYDPEYAEQITEAFVEAKQPVQIVFSDYYEIRGKKNQRYNKNLIIKRILLTPLKFRFFASQKWIKRAALKYGNAISCPAVTFNKAAIKLPLFECDMICNVDWQAWEKLSRKKGSFILVNRQLMGHRIHEESETTKTLSQDQRSREDYIVYSRFWPKRIAKLLTRLYKQSEKSNNL
ncbi:glycosyltransferase [Candidatus Saccharibacteria bacterium]|nr:glycosyltransferase [Candidatus Saccharibacteria bacterium]